MDGSSRTENRTENDKKRVEVVLGVGWGTKSSGGASQTPLEANCTIALPTNQPTGPATDL